MSWGESYLVAFLFIGLGGGFLLFILHMFMQFGVEAKKKTLLITDLVMVAIIIVGIFLFAKVVHNSGRNNGTTGCRNCGRKTDIVSSTGYCRSCHDGFVDWSNEH